MTSVILVDFKVFVHQQAAEGVPVVIMNGSSHHHISVKESHHHIRFYFAY
jgi:hypothetical protein